MTATLPAVPNSMRSSAGTLLYVYVDDATTPLTVYTTPALTTPHPSPIVADSNGGFPLVYANGGGAISVKITDDGGTMLHAYDGIFPISGPLNIGAFTGAGRVSISVGSDLVEVSGYGHLKYGQAFVRIVQAIPFFATWLLKLFWGPHHPEDSAVWVWLAIFWTVLAGLGLWRDRSAYLKKLADAKAN